MLNWARAHRHVLVGVLVLTSAALTAASQGGLLIASAAATFPRGSLDSPANNATVSGGVSVSGWAVDLSATGSTGVDRVQIFVDNAYYGDAVYGRSRPDLAPFGAQFVPAGFLYLLDTSTVSGGTHTLDARAHSTISGLTTSYSHTLVVNGPPMTPRATATATSVPTVTPTPPPGSTATPTPTSTSLPTATPTPLPPTSFTKQFGMNLHLTRSDLQHATIDVDRTKDAGLTSLRSDVTWSSLEPTTKGTYSTTYLAQLDAAVALGQSRGLQQLLVLVDTPAWARSNTGTNRTPPTNPQDYANTLAFLAARYKSTPNMAYEVWNEPDQVAMWNTPGGPDPFAYASLLKKSYTSIKASAPGAIVVGGAIAENDVNYLTNLFTFGGIVGSYDVFSVHTYCSTYAPGSTVDAYRSFIGLLQTTTSLMAQYGDQSKPIWITEFGWDNTLVSEATRATYFRQAVDVARLFPQVQQVMAYVEDQSDDAIFGLVTAQGNLTPSMTNFSLAASVPNSGSSNPMGVVETPQEWGTMYNAGTFITSGWAIDDGATSGPGVDTVRAYIDGAFVGSASYGTPRADIASAYGSRFTSSGFMYTLNLATLTAGYHTFEVRAHSTVTGATTSYARPITIQVIPTSPRGSLDSPLPGSTWHGIAAVSGWAIDTGAPTGTGVTRVAIYLDGIYLTNATYGGYRADIAAGFGARYGNSRFAYTLDLTGVLAGPHLVTAHAQSAQTGLDTIYQSTINVTVP